MRNYDKWAEGRNDGLCMALEIVEKDGVIGLKKEINSRKAGRMSFGFRLEELNSADSMKNIKEHTIKTVLALSLAVLQDEFEFGKSRMNRFRERFMLKTECLMADMVSWADIQKQVEDKTGTQLELPKEEKQ